MLAIVDSRIPQEAKRNLHSFDILELETSGLTYPAISGHPDIFFCPTPRILVVSPNLPEKYYSILSDHSVPFVKGHPASGIRYPASVRFNAAINEKYLVHRLEYTDPVILENCHYLKKIAVKQGYTRCNLLLLKEDHYITSDRGIAKALEEHDLKGILVSPEGIILPGFPNGFIGGAMGVSGDRVFITGSLDHFPEGRKVREFIERLGFSVVEVYNGPLVDGGGILFL